MKNNPVPIALRFRSPLRGGILLRYIFKESVPPFLIGVTFFTFVLMLEFLYRMIELIITKGVSFFFIMEFLFYAIPFNLALALPCGVLMASIMSYGRLSSDNEIIAMKGAGLSPWHIYAPIIVFGIVSFAFVLFFNNPVLSESNYRYRAMLIYMQNVKPSIGIEEFEFQEIPGTGKLISAQTSKDERMTGIAIFDPGRAGLSETLIMAKRGQWRNNEPNSPIVTLVLEEGAIQEVNKVDRTDYSYTPFEHLTVNIPRDISEAIGAHTRSLRELSAIPVYRKIKEMRAEGKEVTPYYIVELHKKVAIPAACLVITLLGATLGTFSKRSGRAIGFGVSIVIVAIYYGFMLLGEFLGRANIIPPVLGAWLPNLIVALTAIYSFWRLFKESNRNIFADFIELILIGVRKLRDYFTRRREKKIARKRLKG